MRLQAFNIATPIFSFGRTVSQCYQNQFMCLAVYYSFFLQERRYLAYARKESKSNKNGVCIFSCEKYKKRNLKPDQFHYQKNINKKGKLSLQTIGQIFKSEFIANNITSSIEVCPRVDNKRFGAKVFYTLHDDITGGIL